MGLISNIQGANNNYTQKKQTASVLGGLDLRLLKYTTYTRHRLSIKNKKLKAPGINQKLVKEMLPIHFCSKSQST